jgi:hypothetical protein
MKNKMLAYFERLKEIPEFTFKIENYRKQLGINSEKIHQLEDIELWLESRNRINAKKEDKNMQEDKGKERKDFEDLKKLYGITKDMKKEEKENIINNNAVLKEVKKELEGENGLESQYKKELLKVKEAKDEKQRVHGNKIKELDKFIKDSTNSYKDQFKNNVNQLKENTRLASQALFNAEQGAYQSTSQILDGYAANMENSGKFMKGASNMLNVISAGNVGLSNRQDINSTMINNIRNKAKPPKAPDFSKMEKPQDKKPDGKK